MSDNKSIEDLLLNLHSMGVEISLYSPQFLNSIEWHVTLKRRSDKLQVEIQSQDVSLYEAVKQGYDEWQEATNKLVSAAFDPPEPPRPTPSTPPSELSSAEIYKTKRALDDEIPF